MSLTSEEHQIFSTRLSKRLFVKPLAVASIFLGLTIAASLWGEDLAPYLSVTFGLVALIFIISPFVKYYLSHFILTNQRVVIRHGLLNRTSYEMILEKIESISVNQSISDRLIWGSGTLVITGTGGTKEEFPDVGNAIAFQEHLNEALHAK